MNIDRKQIDNTLAALKKNGFEAKYFDSSAEAADWLDSQVPDGAIVGQGGSVTLDQLNLLKRFKDRGLNAPNPWKSGLSPEEKRLLLRDALFCDAFFSSANAITENGFILNTDGSGNRVAGSICGPRHLYIVAGVNKLVADEAAAYQRIKYVAPINCKRLGKQTPCVERGECMDCASPDRSCRVYVLLKRPTRLTPATVVLIGEELGI